MSYHYNYTNVIVDLISTIENTEKDTIAKATSVFVDAIKNNKIIHTFGTGHSHMIGIEMFARAGGLANVNAILDPDVITSNGARRSSLLEQLPGLSDIIYDHYNISKGDVMIIISNSGRNAVPIEMAMRAKKEGVFTIALTNLKQSKNTTSRHCSGKKLYECVDLVLDTHAPFGDTSLEVGPIKTGPVSTIISIFILNTIVHESLKVLHEQGEDLPVFQSQNVDGFNNDILYAKYEDRVKHF